MGNFSLEHPRKFFLFCPWCCHLTTKQEFMKKLEEKSVALSKAISMGEAILAICHPDSITTVKHWNTIIKARFEEVSVILLN